VTIFLNTRRRWKDPPKDYREPRRRRKEAKDTAAKSPYDDDDDDASSIDGADDADDADADAAAAHRGGLVDRSVGPEVRHRIGLTPDQASGKLVVVVVVVVVRRLHQIFGGERLGIR